MLKKLVSSRVFINLIFFQRFHKISNFFAKITAFHIFKDFAINRPAIFQFARSIDRYFLKDIERSEGTNTFCLAFYKTMMRRYNFRLGVGILVVAMTSLHSFDIQFLKNKKKNHFFL